uniref:Uncharacterized protein n=1 Tax=Arundo donax TaxID=35708 RepID=A0A0A8YXT9_ARUDO
MPTSRCLTLGKVLKMK